MDTLPQRPNLEHIKKQAKDLLRLASAGKPDALERVTRFLPAASGRTSADVATLGLRLHDAQSCVARQYGFRSWSELSAAVEARALAAGETSSSSAGLRSPMAVT